MHIGKKDVLWNYAAAFLQIAAQVILLPFILKNYPRETIAVWTIFSTVMTLTDLLDFGFNPCFTRNVAYIFSGAKRLKPSGYDAVAENAEIDYGLLKGLIQAMRYFYSRMAVVLFLLLATAGTCYLNTILRTYTSGHAEVYISGIILCIVNIYSFYTFYYDSLLQGKGLIKRSKQIVIVAQFVYIIAGIVLVSLGFGLIAIVSAQALSVIIRRVLSRLAFFAPEMKENLRRAVAGSKKDILKAVYPNALKFGLTGLAAFLVNKSALIVGSLFLPLDVIASYGITVQIIGVTSAIAGVYYATYFPKITQYRLRNDLAEIKKIYTKSCFILLGVYIFFGSCLLFFGNWGLNLIGSKTPLLPAACVVTALIISLLEKKHGIAGSVLSTKNEVPFFKAAMVSGVLTLLLLFSFLKFTHMGIWGMILAPGIAQGLYQNWKWPLEVFRELKT